MFCMYCGAEITTPNPVFCSHCGKRLATASTGDDQNELSFASVDHPRAPSQPPAAMPSQRPLPPWNFEALRCPPYTFGPHFRKYKMHGTWESPEGRLSGDCALTLTGFEFASKGGDVRIYYQSMLRAEQSSSSTILIEADDGRSYEFKLAVPKAWIEKIQEMVL